MIKTFAEHVHSSALMIIAMSAGFLLIEMWPPFRSGIITSLIEAYYIIIIFLTVILSSIIIDKIISSFSENY